MNEINFSDNYFFSANNIISLLFMWILWNESARKCLYTLLFFYFLFMRIWCSNYHNMQYYSSSNHILIINPSYDVHHVYESQSDGKDHQWFQNTILTDVIKMTFMWLYHIFIIIISMIYSLVQERDHFNHSKRTWFPFMLMLSDQNKVGLKYEPGCFADLHYLLTW